VSALFVSVKTICWEPLIRHLQPLVNSTRSAATTAVTVVPTPPAILKYRTIAFGSLAQRTLVYAANTISRLNVINTLISRQQFDVQSSSHCLSHLLLPEKHHLGLRPRGHSYALSICPNNICKRSFISRCLFCFLWSLNSVSFHRNPQHHRSTT